MYIVLCVLFGVCCTMPCRISKRKRIAAFRCGSRFRIYMCVRASVASKKNCDNANEAKKEGSNKHSCSFILSLYKWERCVFFFLCFLEFSEKCNNQFSNPSANFDFVFSLHNYKKYNLPGMRYNIFIATNPCEFHRPFSIRSKTNCAQSNYEIGTENKKKNLGILVTVCSNSFVNANWI